MQHGRDLQLGVEVINLSRTAVTLGQVRSILPMGGLRAVSQQWAPCGTISPSWEATEGGTFIFIGASTGEVEAGSRGTLSSRRTAPPGSASPSGC